jgi:hypothetical protein
VVGAAIETKAAGHWYAARHRVRAGLLGAEVPEKLLEWPPVPLSELGWQKLKDRFWSAPAPSADEVPDPEEHAAMLNMWHPRFGDRRQQLAIIGIDMREQDVRTLLDACLLTEKEMALEPARWATLPDPFSAWGDESPVA